MLTRPDRFAAAHQRFGATGITIVKLTDGTSTWYFSTAKTTMTLGSVVIYPGLKTSPIPESADPLKKSWAKVTVSISIDNREFKNDTSSDPLRVSDEVNGIAGRDVSIYLMAGSGVTAISDCLLRFYGIVSDEPIYDRDKVTIKATNKAVVYSRTLPRNMVVDTYANTPAVDQKIPLVYGEFTITGDDSTVHTMDGLGLAAAIRTDKSGTPKYVVSDHVMHEIAGIAASGNDDDGLYLIDSAFDDPVACIDAAVDCNDSGRGTAELIQYVRGYVYPVAVDQNNPNTTYITDPLYGVDRDIATAMTIKDNADAGVGGLVSGKAYLDINMPDKVLTSFRFQIQFSDRISGSIDPPAMALYNKAEDAIMQTPTQEVSDVIGYTTGSIRTNTTELNGRFNIGEPSPDSIRILQTHQTGGDGGTDDQDMLKVYVARCKCQYCPTDLDDAFVACKGREYGSWITSRSSNYAAGDCIEDPAGIIESILRDELGLTNDELDQPSFISAENTSIDARINITSDNQNDSDNIVKQLCMQATFSYFFDARSKAKLIPLNDNTPTTDVTIPWSHIYKEKITISKWSDIVNRIECHSRWQAEYDSMADVDTYNNTTSQAARAVGDDDGIFKYKAEWKNIAGTSAAHIANHLIRSADGSASDDDGLWANEHVIIEFETPAFFYAHLEIGDWIELDDTTIDPHIKCYGASWSGKQFLVIGITQSGDATKIKAIELF